MADYAIHEETLLDIADVIRKKDGTQALIDPADFAGRVNLMGMLEVKTASGAIASFSDGADGVPLKSGVFGIVPSGGGGTPSTPVPIVGRSGMTISHCGKNLLPNKTYQRNASTLRIGTDNIDGRIRLKRGNYSISVVTNKNPTIHYTMDGYNTMTVAKTVDGNRHYGMFSIIDEEVLVFFHLSQSGITAEDVSNMQLESGTVTTDYEPYEAPATHAVSFGSTVYGGEYECMSGTLTVTNPEKLKFNDVSLVWTYQSSYSRFRCQSLNAVIATPANNQTALDGLLCSCYPTSVANSSYASKPSISVNVSGDIFVYDDNYTDVSTWLNAIGNEEFTYPLATPTETEIDPTPINSRLGSNNIWCDTGDAEVEYRSTGTIHEYPTGEGVYF